MSNIDNPDYDGYEECSFLSSIFLFLVIVEFKPGGQSSPMFVSNSFWREGIEMILERE